VHPARAVGCNEMPFGRDTDVVPSNINIVLHRCPVPPWEGEIWESEPYFWTLKYLDQKHFIMGMLICKLALVLIVAT